MIMTNNMETLKINFKYFTAVANGTKKFELRHKPIKEGTVVKLVCEGVGHLCFLSGDCELLDNYYCDDSTYKYLTKLEWWDSFCEEYCKKRTYCISIVSKGSAVWY